MPDRNLYMRRMARNRRRPCRPVAVRARASRALALAHQPRTRLASCGLTHRHRGSHHQSTFACEVQGGLGRQASPSRARARSRWATAPAAELGHAAAPGPRRAQLACSPPSLTARTQHHAHTHRNAMHESTPPTRLLPAISSHVRRRHQSGRMNDVHAEGTWRVDCAHASDCPAEYRLPSSAGWHGGGGCPYELLLLSLLLSDPTAEDLPLALLRRRLCRGGASGFGGGRAPLARWAATSLGLWHQLRIQKHDDDRHVVPAA